MLENNKKYLLSFGILILVISLISSILAIPSYDQTVYKKDLNYRNDGQIAKYHSEKYSNQNHYSLPSKCSYERQYLENNYYQRSYQKRDYIERSYQKNKKGFLGTYVKEYTVEIKNTGNTGEYFIVNFKLKDKYDFEIIESVTNYIKTGETEKFVYRDVQFEKNEILKWTYTINQVQ